MIAALYITPATLGICGAAYWIECYMLRRRKEREPSLAEWWQARGLGIFCAIWTVWMALAIFASHKN